MNGPLNVCLQNNNVIYAFLSLLFSIGVPEVVESVLKFHYFSMFPVFTVIVKDQYPVNNTLVNIHSSSQMRGVISSKSDSADEI